GGRVPRGVARELDHGGGGAGRGAGRGGAHRRQEVQEFVRPLGEDGGAGQVPVVDGHVDDDVGEAVGAAVQPRRVQVHVHPAFAEDVVDRVQQDQIGRAHVCTPV